MAIKITNVSVYGFQHALRALRRYHNSNLEDELLTFSDGYIPNKNELAIMKIFVKTGPSRAKFTRFIVVYADIRAPMHWWMQAKSYRYGLEHIMDPTNGEMFERELTVKDFDHSEDDKDILQKNIEILNDLILQYKKVSNNSDQKVKLLRRIKTLIPSSILLESTVMISYQTLRSMYIERRNQKSEEWQDFFKFIEKLPNWETLIAGKD